MTTRRDILDNIEFARFIAGIDYDFYDATDMDRMRSIIEAGMVNAAEAEKSARRWRTWHWFWRGYLAVFC